MKKNHKTFEWGDDRWFRLDNSAALYPMVISKTTQSLFRIGVELDRYIDKENLENAVNAILPRFPSFAVQLRHGFFRHYLEANNNRVPVCEDDGVLLQKINLYKNKRFFFKVSYYKKLLLVDFFHALCDGTSALEFIKTLAYQYLLNCGVTITPDSNLMLPTDKPTEQEFEDSFVKYYRKFKLQPEIIKKMRGTHAVHIDGKQFRKVGYGLTEGTVPTEGLKVLATKYGCTVTVLVVAYLLLSVAEIQCSEPQKNKLVAMVPINLRRMFPSATMQNFTTISYIGVDPNKTERTLEAYIAELKAELGSQLDHELLLDRLSFTSFMDKKWYMKYMPLLLKTFFTKLGRAVSRKTMLTLIMSNVGVVKMPPEMQGHIGKFLFNLNCSKKAPNNVAMITHGNRTAISFTRSVRHTNLERTFFRKLSDAGLDVEITSNLRDTRY